MIDRLARIETRLDAIETAQRESGDRTPVPARPESPPATEARTGDSPPRTADAFAPGELATGPSLAVAVTRAGWQVQGKTVNDAQLKALLSGVGSVTVRAEDGASQADVTRLLDLLQAAEIQRIAIARFSDRNVEPPAEVP